MLKPHTSECYVVTIKQKSCLIIIDLKCNWCTAVEINTGSNTVVVISVYLPYQSPDNEVEYLEKLGYINAVTNDLDTTCFVIYIIYSQDTVIDNIIAILYECKMCAV